MIMEALLFFVGMCFVGYWLLGYLDGERTPKNAEELSDLRFKYSKLLDDNYLLIIKLNRLKDGYKEVVSEYDALIDKYNLLVRKYNSSRGQKNDTQFSKDELQDLLRLCHPDKHNNSEKATKVTQKILELRRG